MNRANRNHWPSRSALTFLVAFSFLATPILPTGAETRPEPYDLDPLVIVAPPIIGGNLIDRYGSASSVITEEQLRDLNAQDLPTALRRTPGITISRFNTVGSFGGAEGGGIFIRGMGSSRPGAEIKTFIDGVPMYMGVWNHPLLDLLSIDSASSIEVFKSPRPQDVGNAFAAINIEPKRRVHDGFQTDLNFAGGSHGTAVQQAEHAGREGRIDYFLGQSFRTSDGHREMSGGDLQNYFARVGWEIDEYWYLSAFGLRTDNSAWDPGEKGGNPLDREGEYKTEAWLGSVALQHRHERAHGRFQIFINDVEGDQVNRPDGRPDTTWLTEHRGIRLKETLMPWTDGEVIAGIDYDETAGKGRNGVFWDGETRRLLSPYLAVSHLFGNPSSWHAIPSAGSRYYDHNRHSSEIAPHAGLIVGRAHTQFHFGYARGVIYPGLEVQVLSETVIPALAGSWRDLEAETVDHFEVGVSHTRDRLRTDLIFFRDEGRNRYVIVPPPPPPPAFANVGKYRTQGLETTLTYTPVNTLSIFGGLTLLDSNPSNLPYTPEATWTSGANWRFTERFQLNIDGQYVSGMNVGRQARRAGPTTPARVDSHFLANGKLSFFPSLADTNMNIEMFIAGENLADVSYEYQPGYPMPGISVMFGTRVSF